MGHPNETEAEVTWNGDVPDEGTLAGSRLDTGAAEPEDEPLVGSIEDLENGSEVGWSD